MQFVASDDNFADPIIFRRKIIHTSLKCVASNDFMESWMNRKIIFDISIRCFINDFWLSLYRSFEYVKTSIYIYYKKWTNNTWLYCSDIRHCGKLLIQKHQLVRHTSHQILFNMGNGIVFLNQIDKLKVSLFFSLTFSLYQA